ncbi:MAG: hypothetical protein DHS20C01_20640 [marine bacterium B5-7]|nr:MAG: hypothetical protein DHS20C01_20640 [marine bacterium B5-7]
MADATSDAGDRDDAPESVAERRQLTVMFCDLADSTALSNRIDLEELNRLNRTYQQSCTEIVDAYHGFVARYMGDGLLCYFGYPKAHENDAENAVRCALEIIERVPPLLELDDGTTGFVVRIGIATGPVVVGEVVGEGDARESTAVGRTPNLAARLESLAVGGGVVISEETHRLIGDLFVCQDAESNLLKGFDKPIRSWRVIGRMQSGTRFEATSGVRLTPFVGRQREIDLLDDCWRESCAGRGQIVLLSGEPGIGKSRLVRSVIDRTADAGVNVLQCSPYHRDSAYFPVIEQLERDFRATAGSDLGHWLIAEFEERGIDIDDTINVLRNLIEPGSVVASSTAPPLTGAEAKRQMLELLQRWYLSSGEGAARSLVIEDLHWIDPSTQELVDLLSSRVNNVALLMVLSFRPEYSVPWVDFPYAHLVNLNRMTPGQCEDMVREVLGDSLSATMVKKIVERTDGIPLFVEELSRMLAMADSKLDEGQLEIPATLADSLNARLDALGDVRRTAQAAAVIGREFDVSLTAVLTGLESDDLNRHLDQLVASGLVFRFGSGEDARYQFKHALVQDAAYAGLLRERREQFHRRAAIALEERSTTRSVQPDLVAHHFENAGELAQAIKYRCIAGQAALDQSATTEALSNFKKAQTLRADSLDADDAMDLSIQMGLSASYRFADNYQDALGCLDKAEVHATSIEDIEALNDICNLRGNIYFPLGNLEGCIEQHGRSLEYAKELGSLERQARAIGGLGDAHYLRGEMKTATARFIECCKISERNGFVFQDAANRAMIGWSRLYELEIEQAYDNAMDGIQLCIRCGHLRGQMIAESLAVFTLNEMDQAERAAGHAATARQLAQQIGARNFEAAIVFFATRFTDPDSDCELQRESIIQAADRSRELGFGYHGPAIIGGLLSLTSDAAKRARLSQEAEEALASSCVGHNYYWFYRHAMDAALHYQDFDSLKRYSDALTRYDKTEQSAWTRFFCERAEVLGALTKGECDKALLARRDALLQEAMSKKLKQAAKMLESIM